MEQRSMTALVSAFSRAYHYEHNEVRIFADSVARKLLSDEEYKQIAENMSKGIEFFNPQFSGGKAEALRWVVDNQLSPSPLGRAAFAEKALEVSTATGAEQYLIFGAGYDTFAYRQPQWAKKLQISEIDHPATGNDKLKRLKSADIDIPPNTHQIAINFTEKDQTENLKRKLAEQGIFDERKLSFCSMLGLSYYLSTEVFENLLADISGILSTGSAIVFDYPDENSYTDKAGKRARKQAMMAAATGENMLASYSYEQMERMLAAHNMLIYEHLTPEEITTQYFSKYNKANPDNTMSAFDNVNYCLAVRRT